MAKKDPTKPDLTLLIKIGSAVVHAQELVETNFKNADFDVPAFKTVAYDPEVAAWVKAMGPFLPKKRGG